MLTKYTDPRPNQTAARTCAKKNVVLSHVGFDAGEIKIEQAYYRGMLGTAENETQPQNVIFALPSPTVFGRNRRSDQAKTGPSRDTEVIDECDFPYNTGKIGPSKNKLPSRHQPQSRAGSKLESHCTPRVNVSDGVLAFLTTWIDLCSGLDCHTCWRPLSGPSPQPRPHFCWLLRA